MAPNGILAACLAALLCLAMDCAIAAERQPDVLGTDAACKLAAQRPVAFGKSYSIKGTYVRNFEWGEYLMLAGCDDRWAAMSVTTDGEAAAKLARYRGAVGKKCPDEVIMGDSMNGVFTGAFKELPPRVLEREGRPPFVMPRSIFVIDDYESAQPVACAK